MKQRTALPKIDDGGAVCPQWVRCGRPNCRCASGTRHGPYYYRFVRRHGRLVKRYVRLADATGVQAACAERRERQHRAREEVRGAAQQWRELLALIRGVERRG